MKEIHIFRGAGLVELENCCKDTLMYRQPSICDIIRPPETLVAGGAVPKFGGVMRAATAEAVDAYAQHSDWYTDSAHK